MVAGEQQPSGTRIKNAEREHSAKSGKARFAPFDVSAKQHLGVAGGGEFALAGTNLGSEFFEVVDLAVVDQNTASDWIDHRLRGGVREIEDGKARVAQGEEGVGGVGEPFTRGVGAAMVEMPDHPAKGVSPPVGIRTVRFLEAGETGYATHRDLSRITEEGRILCSQAAWHVGRASEL